MPAPVTQSLPPNVPSRPRWLPTAARRALGALIRRTGWKPQPRYVYQSDGLATVHYSPFLHDPEFSHLYDEMAADWFVEFRADVRWRMWMLTRLARQASLRQGNFAEFGVYRAGCAFMVLALTPPARDRIMYLFDTYAGIPEAHLAQRERRRGLGGLLANTSVELVEQRLLRFDGRYAVCAGDVFETLPATETGPLAFAHVDLNTAAATRHVLEYSYARLVPGAAIVFDDYGYGDDDTLDERAEIDAFFGDKPESVIALPTGQAFVIKN